MKTNNGKRGGVAIGKRHKFGGIKAMVTDTNKPVELETGEIIINRQASAANCEQLSAINQSAGNGVAIDCDATRQNIAQTQLPVEVINAPPMQPSQPSMEGGGMMQQTPLIVDLNDVWSIVFWSIEKPS